MKTSVLAKSFRIAEDVRIDLRGEAFNILNRTIFGTGNTNLNSNVFGIVTSQSNNPRQMQVASEALLVSAAGTRQNSTDHPSPRLRHSGGPRRLAL